MAGKSCCGDTSAAETGKKGCGCGAQTDDSIQNCEHQKPQIEAEWVIGTIQTPVGKVLQVSTKLNFKDTLGSWKCRWSIGRMDYKIEPGIYGIGKPESTSPVLVTANYKMTFDRLREQLGGMNLWIVVLDTDGVNVWCAAGKGTFGTEELNHRIATVQLDKIVTHKTIILPQLGAVGVAAHTVAKQSGFRVVYGPVRAEDIKAFLANGRKATEDMRTVRFTLADRIVLTPMELVGAMMPVIISFGVLFILNAIGFGHYGFADMVGLLGAIITGCVVAPILLPWIPGRAFAFKGVIIGLIWAVVFLIINGFPTAPAFDWFKATAYFLILPSLSAFCTMNFTGSSTFTSLSGVDREMKFAVPTMLFSAAGGVILLLVSDFVKLFG
ncbi:MAG: mercury methylation corrinoid protein HgcA [Eubacteriales bacterium]